MDYTSMSFEEGMREIDRVKANCAELVKIKNGVEAGLADIMYYYSHENTEKKKRLTEKLDEIRKQLYHQQELLSMMIKYFFNPYNKKNFFYEDDTRGSILRYNKIYDNIY